MKVNKYYALKGFLLGKKLIFTMYLAKFNKLWYNTARKRDSDNDMDLKTINQLLDIIIEYEETINEDTFIIMHNKIKEIENIINELIQKNGKESFINITNKINKAKLKLATILMNNDFDYNKGLVDGNPVSVFRNDIIDKVLSSKNITFNHNSFKSYKRELDILKNSYNFYMEQHNYINIPFDYLLFYFEHDFDNKYKNLSNSESRT